MGGGGWGRRGMSPIEDGRYGLEGDGWGVQSNNVLVYRSAEPIDLPRGEGEFIHIYTLFFDLFLLETCVVKCVCTRYCKAERRRG